MLHLTNASCDPLWHDINLDVAAGEFVAVLGPNGSGKSTLLGTVLGTRKLSSGTISAPKNIGFIPQQRMFPPELPVRVRDLVSLSLEHRPLRRPRKGDVDTLLDSVGALHLADARVGTLSGGQQQLVRQAQSFAKQPDLILADEPLLSLDVARQRDFVSRLHAAKVAVVMVTHSIDPVIDIVDKVLYLGPNGHVVGSADEVLRSEVLSELYGAPVEVVRVGGKTVIL
ncbi:metal ABC transporter ATP-binding protein [Corynebacterium pseudogenitalium]|uniref:Metal ABC transporter ATP-binding protein n=1 Tax=Corynebacterium pseudogenitalium TaxID=38303 RepID=A0ABD4TSK7_9CORY|nr:metal ABC transporter ATP-binding protein [Corynebacterium pseudogenitalium]MCQ4614640.1 metal ABC transporter ATP-binding protein [Corynebacterium pseudogenitalium]